jgi:toxin ParE1/3/4
MRVRFNPAARLDLQLAARYIAADSPNAARRWVETVRSKCAKLAENPRLGVSKSEAGPNVRMLVVGSYVVFYEPASTGIEILRVLHGARQWEDLL